MKNPYLFKDQLPKFGLWQKFKDRRVPISFDLEITARCNNDCRHCYINLPANDLQAQQEELSLDEIADIADQAIAMGALWCLITGGEPLLRKDFQDIYLRLKRKGLLVSIFTNACLVNEDHIRLFLEYPPRDIEVTTYGIKEQTYEKVTRRPGSFNNFKKGLRRLLDAGLDIRLKTVALRSNVNELPLISEFCRKYTMDYFRFDPFLHLRYDGNQRRNEEILAERLQPEEIVAIEQNDTERSTALEKNCDKYNIPSLKDSHSQHLFNCGAGNYSFVISYNGIFRLCADLWHPDCIYDLRKGTLAEAWRELVPRVRDMQSSNPEFLKHCRRCPIINLCLWCPAHAYLETGKLDGYSQYFCSVAHARNEAIEKIVRTNN